MVELISILVLFLVIALIFIISGIPLHLAVKTLGGKTNLVKTGFIVFISGLIVAAIQFSFKVWGGVIAFIVLIWIYHEAFRLKWFKAFIAWFLQFLFLILLAILVGMLFPALAILLF